MKQVMLAVVMAVSVMVAGCATTDTSPQEQVLARAAVVSATGKFVRAADDPQERADRVVAVLDTIDRAAEGGTVTIAELEERARSEIPWGELAPEDVVLADALIAYVAAELEARAGDAEVDASLVELGDVSEVLGWVRNGAEMYAAE